MRVRTGKGARHRKRGLVEERASNKCTGYFELPSACCGIASQFTGGASASTVPFTLTMPVTHKAL
jgi:hypothetical protein